MQHWSKIEGDLHPMGRSGHAAVCLNYGNHPQVLITGGRDQDDNFLDDLWMLDVETGRWSKVRS